MKKGRVLRIRECGSQRSSTLKHSQFFSNDRFGQSDSISIQVFLWQLLIQMDFHGHYRRLLFSLSFHFHKDLLGDPMDGDLTAPGRGSEEAEEMESLGFDRITEVLLLPIVESSGVSSYLLMSDPPKISG